MRQHFKLHHHKHTGKLIHHRHTSYWALILLVIISGAFALAIERVAQAETLAVSATVPAPIPSTAPAFSPKFSVFKTNKSLLLITGTCPVITPAVIIALYSGPTLLGSGTCQPDGTFSVEVALQPGEQTITAQVVTITGQTGLSSDPIVITYTPPPTPSPETPTTPTSPAATSYSGGPLQSSLASGVSFIYITTEKPFISYRATIPTALQMRIDGGIPPYIVAIAWGDGETTTTTASDNDMHAYPHTFTGDTSAPAAITVTDSNGAVLTRYLAVVNALPASDNATINPAGLLDSISSHLLNAPIIAYVFLLGALTFLWHYENTHYRQRVGIPTHYHWQHKKHTHK